MASTSLRSVIASASRGAKISPMVMSQRSYAQHNPRVVQPTMDDYDLPEIHLGQTHPNRYRQYYEDTLQEDLLYMTYNHRNTLLKPDTPKSKPIPNPYEANRTPVRTNPKPNPTKITHTTIPHLESILVHTMVKEAIGNKQQLLNAIMALRAISGESPGGGGRDSSKGVQIIRAKTGAAAWKLREDMPIAAKVELKGDLMYDFIQALVDCVLPRLRDYPGVPIPALGGSRLRYHMIGPVISFGLPPAAMGLFPQIETNIDAYPRLHGFHMYFKTNLKGEHAEMWARNLLSGFKIPFYRAW